MAKAFNIENIPADRGFHAYFIPSEKFTLTEYHADIKREVLCDKDKAKIKDFLRYNRWNLGNHRGQLARAGAETIRMNFDAWKFNP